MESDKPSSPTLSKLEILEGMDALLSGPDRWCTETSAQNELRLPVPVCSGEACRWCVYGAFIKVMGESYRTISEFDTLQSVRVLSELLGFSLSETSIGAWNDSNTFEGVKAHLASCIARERQTA